MNEEGEVIDCGAPRQDNEPSMPNDDAGGEQMGVEHNFVEAGESLDGFCSQLNQTGFSQNNLRDMFTAN